MRRYFRMILIPGLLCLGLSCGNLNEETEFPDGGLLKFATPLPSAASQYFGGNFSAVYAGLDRFGGSVSVLWAENRLSLSTPSSANYAVLAAGCLQQDVLFEGAYRDPVNQEKGLIRLYIRATEGGSALCAGAVPAQIAYEGSFGENFFNLKNNLRLTFAQALKSTAAFLNIAHRGGCRTVDSCGVSENSLQVISLASSLGANGIEIDVNRTKDGVAVLYHDDDFNTRLIKGIFCLGPVQEMPYLNMRIFCRLKQGETIPTLRQALDLVMTLQNIRMVWLDPKTPAIMQSAVLLAKEFNQQAVTAGRNLEIVVGLPDADYLNAFLSIPEHTGVPCLAEESVAMADAGACKYYGPRWTSGYQTDAGNYLHSSGRKILFWTLDEPAFIQDYLSKANPDGFITNRPYMIFSILQHR